MSNADPDDIEPVGRKAPRSIARLGAGVVALAMGAATVLGLFRSPETVLWASVGMAAAVVLILVIDHAAKVVAEAQREMSATKKLDRLRNAQFWELLVRILAVFVLGYFILILILMVPKLQRAINGEPAVSPSPGVRPSREPAADPTPPDGDPEEQRLQREIAGEARFETAPFETEVFVVPVGTEFVYKGYSVSGGVDVEFVALLAGERRHVSNFGGSETGTFFHGKGEVLAPGTRLVLRSLTGKGRYRYKFSGYLRPARS